MKLLRIVIVEDEAVIARHIAYQLKSIDAGIEIEAILATVAESIAWFNNNTLGYDLVLMDIQLTDGLSFDIFKQATISKPVIFVTAYDDYAIKAFKSNGIDYILKPFDITELTAALKKFRTLATPVEEVFSIAQVDKLLDQINQQNRAFKKSFLVHYRDKLVPVESAKIAWFYTANELVYANTVDDRRYVIDFTMEQLEQQLDPEIFYRANRQFIINRKAVTEVNFYFNGRLSLKIAPEAPESILISKARVSDFRLWMER